ncbi:MAG: hypothetical protein GZ093_11300 [Rhodoferax sp.]|uniref:hypothetical protein n=1 Tax=Rhodoferax sp. TaxID=50421 RepID=UPI0014002518|nr:hypothetical protein [Rhodoferax sp.]NDP39319.1 hypothetical protein [Rhodoferax sp.]
MQIGSSQQTYAISTETRGKEMTVTGSTVHSQGHIRQKEEVAALRTEACAAMVADFALAAESEVIIRI